MFSRYSDPNKVIGRDVLGWAEGRLPLLVLEAAVRYRLGKRFEAVQLFPERDTVLGRVEVVLLHGRRVPPCPV